MKLIDLSHALHENIPCWEPRCGFHLHTEVDYGDCTNQSKFRIQALTMPAGIGTHMDAPAHCIPGGKTIADFSLTQLFSPAVVIDVSQRADENYYIDTKDIEFFEQQYGQIPKNALVIFYTGWEKYWAQPERYRNNLHFPKVAAATAELLLTKDIAGIGIDTLSPDGEHDGFPVHQLILGAGKYIIENVANAKLLPAQGAFTLAAPIKLAAGTEATTRLIGLIP